MKNLKVLKIGGGVLTSSHALPVARDVIFHELSGGEPKKLILVVSAMGHKTRELIAKFTTENINPEMKDLQMSTGEISSVAEVANYLIDGGIRAGGFTGRRLGIITDDNFGDANIIDVKTDVIRDFLKENDVAVIPGFIGETKDGRTTTLGFNGSDTTAFHAAYVFDAESCTLFKDVNGIYDKDPKKNPDARLYETINYREVLNGNAKGVIHEKALKLCREMFEQQGPDIIVRNINLSQKQFTTISRKRTRFYRN